MCVGVCVCMSIGRYMYVVCVCVCMSVGMYMYVCGVCTWCGGGGQLT